MEVKINLRRRVDFIESLFDFAAYRNLNSEPNRCGILCGLILTPPSLALKLNSAKEASDRQHQDQ